MTSTFGYKKVLLNDIPDSMTSIMRLNDVQFYSPIFKKFFVMNEKNAEHISLRYNRTVSRFVTKSGHSLYKICVDDGDKNEREIECFVKCSPMFDPIRYLCQPLERHEVNENMQMLPYFRDELNDTNADSYNVADIYNECNNTAYIDGFFCYLSSILLHEINFVNGIDCYGLFLGLHEKLSINMIHDLEELADYEDFKSNQNVIYEMGDTNSKILESLHRGSRGFKKKLRFDKSSNFDNLKNTTEVKIDIEDVEVLCDEEHLSRTDINQMLVEVDPDIGKAEGVIGGDEEVKGGTDVDKDCVKGGGLESLKDFDEGDINIEELSNSERSARTYSSVSSSCSSRSSNTHTDDTIDSESDSSDDSDSYDSFSTDSQNDVGGNLHKKKGSNPIEDEYLYLDIYDMPSQIILMERCVNTVDSLLEDNDFSDLQINAMLAQLVLTLGVYQKVYKFTHNDLHCNNIMYINTDKQYLYYCYNGIYYKIPTYGRIYKIIDFDRAIYTFQGKLYMGNCFKDGAVASKQYNYGEYYNKQKPEIEPNMSFDLCRFACSIFDILVDLDDDYKTIKCPIKKIIMEWCLDDNGKSVLYKNSGVERYPDFKLYKMIARKVHNHTPEMVIKNGIFSKYQVKHNILNKKTKIMNIDRMPELWRVESAIG